MRGRSGSDRTPHRSGSRPGQVDAGDRGAAETSALRILSAAAQSSRQLRRRLERQGYNSDTALEVAGRLETGGWVDDAALAESVARRRLVRGYGPRRIAADLMSRGVDAEVIDHTLADVRLVDGDAAVAEVAFRLRRRYPSGRLEQAELRRLAAALQRRGFGHAAIRAALREIDAADATSGEAAVED